MIEETGMSILERYRAYGDAFVESYEDAVYDGNGPECANGRDTLTMRWAVTDTKAGVPAPIISGVDAAVFESDQVARLRDGFDTTAEKTMAVWMPAHGGS
jgi:hypothetical protein